MFTPTIFLEGEVRVPHTPNVRISARAHELLRQLAEEEQRSMQSILDRALERYRRERFLRGASADFAALKQDPKSWNENSANGNYGAATLRRVIRGSES